MNIMNNAFVYLSRRFFYRIAEFLRHWYLKSPKFYANFVLNKLEDIDYHIAWKITLKKLFEPLYGDYSALGYILGFIFRLGRLIIGSFIYALIFLVAISLYLIWLLTPIYIIYRIIYG